MAEDRVEAEADRIEADTTPPTPVIYETVRRNGEQEMARPVFSLWWSGLAAGLSMSFSLLAVAILRMHLPDAPWRDLVSAIGYPLGFVIVVLSRQQLFTENTVTVVLPVMASPKLRQLRRAARLWGIVLGSNLVGTLFAAAFCTFTDVITPDVRAAMLEISRHSMEPAWPEMLLRGVTAGYLMATMVWLMPAAGGAPFAIVVTITYVIGAGGFAHIIVGSMEAFLLLLREERQVGELIGRFFLPALAGNIIGGTALFAMLSHAQVAKEMESKDGGRGPRAGA